MALLLILSALVSASEVAFFSLAPKDIDELHESESKRSKLIVDLLAKPKLLLATHLIVINLLNIGVVITSDYVMASLFDFAGNYTLRFVLQVVVVTFLIVLIAEIVPKVYANSFNLATAKLMCYPVFIVEKICWPLSMLLINSTRFIDKRVKKKGVEISVEELSHALEMTEDGNTTETEKKLLKGIVQFGTRDVKQIMKQRLDVVAFEYEMSFDELLNNIRNFGFSRVPVFKESIDKIAGVLYIKDLLGNLKEGNSYRWQSLLREPFFVPENKKIDDLLKEFQSKKIHLAIVVDEYGGTSGIVTLEDIIEEIVGEINDEFDDDEIIYSKLDDHTFVFEGKINLNDLCRVLSIESDEFENVKGESDTLAGFILEYTGSIPKKNEKIKFKDYTFIVESVDSRKIKRVKVELPNNDNNE